MIDKSIIFSDPSEIPNEEPEEIIIYDSTGAELTPGDPTNCKGNGKHPDFECYCGECDFYLQCYPATIFSKQPCYAVEENGSMEL